MNDKYLAGIEPERRPFDLEAAKRGEPLVTRYGRSVKFVAYVPEAREYKVVAFLEGEDEVRTFTKDGLYCPYSPNVSENDLFMAPNPKRTVWLNIYEKNNSATWYPSEDFAKSRADSQAVAVAVPVQIEVW